MNKRGFTLIQILLAVMIVSILATLSVYYYSRSVEEARSTEAYINVDAIRKSEEIHKAETGTYVAAEDTQEVNELFSLAITPKYYKFKVVLPDEDSYIIIAERIGADIEAYLGSGRLPPKPIVIASDDKGYVDSGYGEYIGTGGSSGGATPSGGTRTGGGGGSGDRGTGGGAGGDGGGAGSSGDGGGAGSSGDGGGAGSSGGGAGSGVSGGTSDGGSTGDNGGVTVTTFVSEPVEYDSTIESVLALLQSSATGLYYYNLIQNNGIEVIFEDFGLLGALAFWVDIATNTIFLNQDLKTTMPESAIAAVICHEATHADYDYYPQKWIDYTLEQHPELEESDLHITVDPGNSIDQEFNAFVNAIEVWKEVKGSDINGELDYLEDLYDQGEAFLLVEVILRYGVNDPYDPTEEGLPLY